MHRTYTLPAGNPGMDAFGDCLDKLIEANHMLRSAHTPDFTQDYSRAQYARNFATVRVSIGRQSGQTTCIVKRATKDDVIVCDSLRMADEIKRLGTAAKVISAQQLVRLEHLQLDRAFRMIWVDETCFGLNLDEMYRFGAKGYEQTFVLLGVTHGARGI